MLTAFSLGPEALDYIREQLEGQRHYALSASLLEFSLQAGDVVTYLPATTDVDQLHRFREGGVATQRVTMPWLIDKVVHYLRSGERRCALFQMIYPSSDPFLESQLQYYIVCNSLVYGFLVAYDHDPSKVERVVRDTDLRTVVGILTTLPEHIGEIPYGSDVPPVAVSQLTARAQHIIVGAYDGEATLLWSIRSS